MGAQKIHLIEIDLLSYTTYPRNYLIYSRIILGPSINGLVTDGNTKICCQGSILALFQSTTANKIDSEHTQD